MNVISPLRYLGVALISASVLALQVTLTRIFSIMIWYHFTYLIIGVALLGGGSAGTFLAVRRWEEASIERRLGPLAAGFSASILITLLILTFVPCDPLGGKAVIVPALVGLFAYFTTLFTTFFLGGLTIAGAFRLWVRDAHRLYSADLLGAGISTVLVTWLIQGVGGPAAMAVIALWALLAALLFGAARPRRWRPVLGLLGLAEVGLIVFTLVRPIQLSVPPSKELGWALRLTGADRPEYTRWNPVARVDVLPSLSVKEPILVGGLSSVYLSKGTPPAHSLRFLTLDGTSMSEIYQFDGDLSRFRFLDHAVISAPYQVGVPRPATLLIGVGGGLDVILARLYEAKSITAIDLNADVIGLLKGPYAGYCGHLADDPRTRLLTAEGRSFLLRDEAHYDLVQGIGLDNFAALSGGAYVLAESYLYTVEALGLALDRLTPEGTFSWTRSLDQPPRETLRLLGLAAEALRRRGIKDPTRHIALIANDTNTIGTLLVSPSPFAQPAIERLRQWAAANHFGILQDPSAHLGTPYGEYLAAPDPRAFEAGYPFNIFPVSDDNPFFYDYFKWSRLRANQGDGGDINTRFPVGNLILLAMLCFSTLAAAAFIAYPLLRHQRGGLKAPHAGSALVYFSILGLGYIFVEIVLIQRFTLFIGYPTRAIATTLFAMLMCSALGSLVAPRVCDTGPGLRALLLLVAASIVLYIVGLPVLFRELMRFPDAARLGLSVVLIAPLAFLMGMPFPTGLRRVGLRTPALVPWVWGLNGVFSVLGSALVIVVSMQAGFTAALAGAALLYALAAAVSGAL